MSDPVTDMGDLDRLLDPFPETPWLDASAGYIALRSLVSELVRQNKALSESLTEARKRCEMERDAPFFRTMAFPQIEPNYGPRTLAEYRERHALPWESVVGPSGATGEPNA